MPASAFFSTGKARMDTATLHDFYSPTVGFTCRRDKQDSTAHQPLNLRKSRLHTHAEGGQVQTVLCRCYSSTSGTG